MMAVAEAGAPAVPAAAERRMRPSLWQEQRAALELAELLLHPVYYGVGVPRGDGSPVLLLPGFLGSDDYLIILRSWLRRLGYRPYPSGLAVCAGPLVDLKARVLRRAEAVAVATGRPLTLIGHSLGGLLSCYVAGQRPDLVEHVITLGSAAGADVRNAGHPMVVAIAEVLLWSGPASGARSVAAELIGDPVPDGIRLTGIYSRDDAVVDWRACCDADPRTSLHEVRGSHVGLAWNAAVYRVLADRLIS